MKNTTTTFRFHLTAALLLIALATAVHAQSLQTPAGPQTPAESRGAGTRMRMANPKAVVYGEEIEVLVDVPAKMPAENRKSLVVRWYDAGKKVRPDEVNVSLSGRVKIRAPFDHPGTYELRLFDCVADCSKAVGVLPVQVHEGKVAGAIRPLRKSVFAPGEPIDVELFLSGNRYYYGQWGGPTIQLLPKREDPVSAGELKAWVERCSSNCQIPLVDLVMTDKVFNPLDGGRGFDEQKLRAQNNRVRIEMEKAAEAQQIPNPLRAPREPGVYEIRLYDRGHSYDWHSYAPYFIDSATIVVQRQTREQTPDALDFVRQVSGTFEKIESPDYFTDFHVEAAYAEPGTALAVEVPLTLSGSAQLVEIDAVGNERLVLNAGDQNKTLLLLRVANTTTYRSGVLRVKQLN